MTNEQREVIKNYKILKRLLSKKEAVAVLNGGYIKRKGMTDSPFFDLMIYELEVQFHELGDKIHEMEWPDEDDEKLSFTRVKLEVMDRNLDRIRNCLDSKNWDRIYAKDVANENCLKITNQVLDYAKKRIQNGSD